MTDTDKVTKTKTVTDTNTVTDTDIVTKTKTVTDTNTVTDTVIVTKTKTVTDTNTVTDTDTMTKTLNEVLNIPQNNCTFRKFNTNRYINCIALYH